MFIKYQGMLAFYNVNQAVNIAIIISRSKITIMNRHNLLAIVYVSKSYPQY